MGMLSEEVLPLLLAEQQAPERRTAAAGIPNLTLVWGYIDPTADTSQNANAQQQLAECSPSAQLTTAQQAAQIEASYNAIGYPAQWVDGYPSNLVQMVANYLKVPVGKPPGWGEPPPAS